MNSPGEGNQLLLDNEISRSAEIFLDELLRFRNGERVLLYMDNGSDIAIAEAIKKRIGERDGQTEIYRLPDGSSLEHQIHELCNRIRQGKFQAVCDLSEQYFYLTPVWRIACESGARIYSIAGLDAKSFINCIGKVNTSAMVAFGAELKNILRQTRRLYITSPGGTDITMKLGLTAALHQKLTGIRGGRLYRVLSRFLGGSMAFIGNPSGILDTVTRATFLGGQIAFRGVPQTIEGVAVIDGYLWPPNEIGSLEEPIIAKIIKGTITEISGYPKKAAILKDWFQGQQITVEHFCIGFNPGAILPAKIMEAERVMGAISIGMGKGFLHTDGIILNPSLRMDRNFIERNGVFTSESMVKHVEKMSIRE